MSNTLERGFRIGSWDVYPQQNLLKSPERARTLEPKVMDVLVFLAERQGEVVSRQQILDAVWREVVVGDEVVSRAVSLLRTELGDDQNNPRYLKTISKRGYCLIADVILVSSNKPQQVQSVSDTSASATAKNPTASITRRTMRKLSFTIVTVLALALAYFAYGIFLSQPESDQNAGNIGKSIAVLPFVDMSADSDNEYFSDGLSEELLNLLTKIHEIRVAARTSSFSYRAKDINITQVGEELNVTHVLEGSVRKTGNHVRITAQLVEVDDGFQLWSETFDRTLDDIFVVQNEIAKAVVDKLSINLLGTMPEVRKTDPEVYSLYLQGNYFLNLQSGENLEKALSALKQALAIDPDYAPAWVSLERTYSYQMSANPAAPEKFRTPRIEAIQRALAIDENLASAWAALAYQRKFYDSDWRGARIAIAKALQLEPNNADVIGSAASLASTFGRISESIELFEKDVSLDPLGLPGLMALGRRYLVVGRIDDAFDAFDRVRAINPDYPGLSLTLARVYMMRGDLENALLETEKTPDEFYYRHQKANFLYMMGREAEAQTLINELLETSADEVPGAMATVYAWRGEGDSAFEWLEIAYEQNDARPSTFLGNLYWRKLTGDPRYSVFVEKIGLLEEWKAMPPEYGGPPEQ
jgi:TolB-like protein/DNA-binding winged helix-turn-helix (wHTH) protein/Tfp pilus assembly protein PilF